MRSFTIIHTAINQESAASRKVADHVEGLDRVLKAVNEHLTNTYEGVKWIDSDLTQFEGGYELAFVATPTDQVVYSIIEE